MDTQVILQALPEILTQLLAFVIVFWILKRYGFGPILQMIDHRRKTIDDSFADIEKRRSGIDTLEKEYKAKLAQIEQEARTKIQEAANLGTVLARDIQDKARQDAEKIVARAQDEIRHDLEKAKLSMRDELVRVSSLIAEKVLSEKLDPRHHEKMVDQFIKELDGVSKNG